MTSAAKNTRKGNTRFYTPRPIKLVAGVEHTPGDWRSDNYAGPGDALVASGICEPFMLPPPGGCSRAWHPHGAPKAISSQPTTAPRYVHIRRLREGYYLAIVTVDIEEQERREAARKVRWEASEAEEKRRLAAAQAARDARLYANATEEEFKDVITHLLSAALGIMVAHAEGIDPAKYRRTPVYPFRIRADTFRESYTRISEAIDLLKAANPVRPGPVAAARADKAFQTFLSAQCIPMEEVRYEANQDDEEDPDYTDDEED